MGFNLIARFLYIYMMSSCLLRCSVSSKPNTLICMLDYDLRGRVIVVDAVG